MKETTRDAVLAVLQTDWHINETDRRRLVGLLRDGQEAGDPTPDRLIRRREVGRLLGRSPKSVDRLAERGILHRITFPSSKRGAGYRLSEVERLVAGTTPQQQDGYAAVVDDEG